MKKFAIVLALIVLPLVKLDADVVPGGKTFLKALTQRDSVLVGDQLRYGVRLEGVTPGTVLSLPDFKSFSSDTLVVAGSWTIDTVNVKKAKKGQIQSVDIEAGIVISPFEEGVYQLPPVPVLRLASEVQDTLVFEPSTMEVCAIPIDTATFVVHDLKGQLKYPVTFRDILSVAWKVLAVLAVLAALVFGLVTLISRKNRPEEPQIPLEAAYIRALRILDGYDDKKWWLPSNQKKFYSAITDALKLYISSSMVEDAKEMTTSELFSKLEKVDTINVSLLSRTRELFDVADMVKFAKAYADDEFNGKARPLAVEFINSTRDVL